MTSNLSKIATLVYTIITSASFLYLLSFLLALSDSVDPIRAMTAKKDKITERIYEFDFKCINYYQIHY